MPYKKRRRKYRRTGSNIQRRLAALEKKGRGEELKIHDTVVTGNVTAAGTVTYLSGIAQGDLSVCRDGLKINLVKVYGSIGLSHSAGGADNEAVRVIIFHDKDCQGVLPGVTDVLEGAQYDALFEHPNRNRFQILYDRTWQLGVVASGKSKHNEKMYTKMPKKGKTLYYLLTTDVIAAAGANALFALTIANQAGADYPQINMYVRKRFYG